MMKKMGSIQDALMKLHKRLEMAHLRLEYADQKMIVPYGTINTWFDDLRGASNEWKDINDELLKHTDIMATLFSKVHWYSPFIYIYHNLCFPQQISSQISTLNTNLEMILNKKLNYGLTLLDVDTTVEEEILVGRIEKDTKKLVEMLVTNNANTFEESVAILRFKNINFYGIVGESGIGKTTLAKKIFNHKRIRDKFCSPPPIWVHVHDNSTSITVVQSITGILGGDNLSSNTNSTQELKKTFLNLIENKQILVVLDDVRDLNKLEDMFQWLAGLKGIVNFLITTRYESIVTVRKREMCHKLSLLSWKDSWALMCKLLFKDAEKAWYMQSFEFEQIFIYIVINIHGHPLSIKTIARILNAKEKIPREWEKVLENIIVSLEPSKTLPGESVYLLPYENLSPYIKQCFIFCAFFPEDYIFEKSILIQQWVVAGLVNEPSISIEEKGGTLMEDVANDYYMELLETNILQPAEECPYYNNEAMCRMNDNLRSFGQSLVRSNGYFQGDVKALEEEASSSSFVPKLHHLVITDDAPLDVFPNIVKKQTSVRTLIFTSKLEITKLPKNLFQKLKFLQILDINGSDCAVLPKSLFKLIHLRHLNLSCLPIKSLTGAIGNLINLQHLILRYCASLLNLPDSITRLHKLKSIDLHQTPLMGMPIGISKLSQLTSLVGFVSSDQSTSHSSLEEIHLLRELRTINIVNLEVGNVLLHSKLLKDHIYLTDLTLSCRGEGQQYDEYERENLLEVFGNLYPPSTIQQLTINGYFGLEFPWITEFAYYPIITSFDNLKRLNLLKCTYCKQLPSFCGLRSLEHVRIEDAWSIESINLHSEWGGYFPRLKSLIFQNMPEWADWMPLGPTYNSLMPLLETLEIINCPKLKSLPSYLAYCAKSLATLTIYKAHSLKNIEGFKSVKMATFLSNHNLSRVSGFPTTCKFEIDDCPELDVTLFSQTSL